MSVILSPTGQGADSVEDIDSSLQAAGECGGSRRSGQRWGVEGGSAPQRVGTMEARAAHLGAVTAARLVRVGGASLAEFTLIRLPSRPAAMTEVPASGGATPLALSSGQLALQARGHNRGSGPYFVTVTSPPQSRVPDSL